MPAPAPKHRPIGWRQRKPFDHRIKSSTARGYGSRWQRLRAAVLANEPLCRVCAANGRATAATEVDHIVP